MPPQKAACPDPIHVRKAPVEMINVLARGPGTICMCPIASFTLSTYQIYLHLVERLHETAVLCATSWETCGSEYWFVLATCSQRSFRFRCWQSTDWDFTKWCSAVDLAIIKMLMRTVSRFIWLAKNPLIDPQEFFAPLKGSGDGAEKKKINSDTHTWNEKWFR